VQAALGRVQLRHIDAFNRGARRNGEILTTELGEVPGVRVPAAGGDHIYVYYPLSVDPARRDDLRRWLLRHGIDTKTSDMADCSTLAAFGGGGATGPVTEASVLEICVYPSLSEAQMRRIARAVRRWASRSTALDRAAPASPSRRATA
jgi:dTDP-4-amino-4,6-dideoxygalactose transaminase